jgi:hypothetical protein
MRLGAFPALDAAVAIPNNDALGSGIREESVG